MKRCSFCGSIIEDHAEYCVRCGRKQYSARSMSQDPRRAQPQQPGRDRMQSQQPGQSRELSGWAAQGRESAQQPGRDRMQSQQPGQGREPSGWAAQGRGSAQQPGRDRMQSQQPGQSREPSGWAAQGRGSAQQPGQDRMRSQQPGQSWDGRPQGKKSGGRLPVIPLIIALLLFAAGLAGSILYFQTYDVHYELNGGTLVSGEPDQKVRRGKSAEEPEVQRDGYLFDGWSGPSDNVKEDRVIEAAWIKTYQVTFDPAGGEIVSGEAEQQVEENKMPAVPEVVLEGSEFTGWDPEVTEASGDCVYTAGWALKKLSAQEVYAKIRPSVAVLLMMDEKGDEFGLGSGFFIDDQGTLVTNYHVIDSAYSGVIALPDGTEGSVLGVIDYDDVLDLAILHTDLNGADYLEICEEPVVTGETVYALGCSEGLESTFSSGNVSNNSREFDGVRCIQVTAPISQGNSGGPLVNVYGQVIGVNSMSLISGQNLNFAIDIKELQNLERDNPEEITLEELTGQMHPYDETEDEEVISEKEDSAEEDDIISDVDAREIEPNDNILTADTLENDQVIYGKVQDPSDKDIYVITPEDNVRAAVIVMPYSYADDDQIIAVLSEVTPDGEKVIADLKLESEDEITFLYADARLRKDTVYVLSVSLPDDYPYHSPAEYQAWVYWE